MSPETLTNLLLSVLSLPAYFERWFQVSFIHAALKSHTEKNVYIENLIFSPSKEAGS